MFIRDIVAFLNREIPVSLQESYDNSGLLVGEAETEVQGILICMDVTEAVVEEAIAKNANLIVAHHPLIFKPLSSITGKTPEERAVIQALRHHIAIYAAHTNLDHLWGGVSFALAEQLGLMDVAVLRPLSSRLRKLVTFCPPAHLDELREALFAAGAGKIGDYDACSFNSEGYGTFRAGEGSRPFVGKLGELHREPEMRLESVFPDWAESTVLEALQKTHPYEEVAYDLYSLENPHPRIGPGVLGRFPEPMPVPAFLDLIRRITGIPVLRYSKGKAALIEKTALCGGAGSFLIGDALRMGAQAFITGDLKYHDFFIPGGEMMLVDAGHFETEQFARNALKEMLSEKFPTFAVLISDVITNPINYL
jgi:dinuclear metal center YbgI/SA1388 family protein